MTRIKLPGYLEFVTISTDLNLGDQITGGDIILQDVDMPGSIKPEYLLPYRGRTFEAVVIENAGTHLQFFRMQEVK